MSIRRSGDQNRYQTAISIGPARRSLRKSPGKRLPAGIDAAPIITTQPRSAKGGFKIVGTSDLIERGSGRNKFKQIPEWFKALMARVEDAIMTAVAQPGESNVQPTSRGLTPVQSRGQFPHK